MLLKETAMLMVQFACNGPQLREKSSSATLSHTWENPDRNESINIEEDDLPFGWSESQFRQKSLSAILSLIWKNPDRNRMVNIEEADLPIALGSWKSVLRIFESPGILWLDSICINQADEDERGRQLSPMKEIYHEAKKTAQWLSCLQDLDQQGGQLEHPVSDHINIEMPGRTDTRQQGRPKTAMDASKSQGNGDYDQGQAFPCFRKMLKVLKRLSDDLHAGSLLSTPIPDHKFNFSGLGGVQYMMQKAWNTGSDWPFNGNSEDLKLEGFPKSGEQEKLLRLQGLRNSHNSWPAKCQTTRPFAPKSANERWKQSSCIMLEKERIPNTDRLYTLDHQLRSRHINLIAFSGTIGTGIFLSSPINGPLSPLMALTLIGLTVLPLMYGLGELAAEFPIGIENSRIKDLNLDQKLPISMTLLATAYSFALLTSSVSEVGSLTDELYTCLSVMAWLAIYPILYWAILKGISWSISRIRLGIQTFTESCTWSPHGRSSRSRSHIGQGLILSLLLWTTPVTAITPSLSTSTPSPCSSFLLAVCVESEKLFSLFTIPQPPFPRSIPPPTLLIALLLTTSLTLAFYTLLQHNPSTKYLLCTSVLLSLVLGSVSAVDIPDLVFRYLFLGVNCALLISGLESVVQRYRVWGGKKQEKEVFAVKDVEAGNKRATFEDGRVGDEKKRLPGY